MVTNTREFKSILLGTRPFKPLYGVRAPFKKWIEMTMYTVALYGAHEWRQIWRQANAQARAQTRVNLVHLAQIETACGLVGNVSRSNNPEITDLLRRVTAMTTVTDEVCYVSPSCYNFLIVKSRKRSMHFLHSKRAVTLRVLVFCQIVFIDRNLSFFSKHLGCKVCEIPAGLRRNAC